MGEVKRFENSRSWVSYLGLNPSERSSGEKRRMGAISKQGSPFLRFLLGARRRERRTGRQELGPGVCPTEGQEAPRRGQSSSGPQAGGAVVLDGAHAEALSRGSSHAGEPESSCWPKL